MKLQNLIIAFVLGAALAVGIWLAAELRAPAPKPTTATVLPTPAAIPAFNLVDHNGNPIDQTVFEGSWDLVFFGFTNCPDVCPLTLQVLRNSQLRLKQIADDAPLPRVVLVSVDPERDTPEKLAQYLAAFGDHNLGITGDLKELEKLTKSLGIYFQKQDSDDEYYGVDHSAAVIVIDPRGRFHSLFGAPHKVENFAHDLPILMGD